MTNKIKILAPKTASKEITPFLDLGIEANTEISGGLAAQIIIKKK